MNTDCTWVEEHIEAYVDRELAREDTNALEKHLAACGHCRRELALAERVRSELRALPELECDDRVTDEVIGQIEGPRHRAPLRSPSWWLGGRLRPALAVAAAVLIITASVVFVQLRRGQARYTPDQIERAEKALRWTFAYLNEVSRQSGEAVRDEVFEAGVIEPVQRAVGSQRQPDDKSDKDENGGSI
jgi:anti-sigma factor (TIGR02949 family)